MALKQRQHNRTEHKTEKTGKHNSTAKRKQKTQNKNTTRGVETRVTEGTKRSD